MQLSDITVEVRDKNLSRKGQIRPEELDLELTDFHNNVGSWVLKLPAEHRLSATLRTPGSGIIVYTRDDVLFSGPTIKPENAATAQDPAGTVTFEGVDDTVILADRLAFPDPLNPDPETQTLGHDIRVGPVEDLLYQFTSANVGPAAPLVRRHPKLTMGTSLGRGPVTQKSARFPVLGNLLADLAVVADLGFRIVQRGDVLVFETYQVLDRSKLVRLDIFNNTLAGHRVAISPPGATQVIVAGQGELVERQFLHLTTPEAQAAEVEWGRRIERFVDQRQTDDIAELTQAGLEVLTEEGFTALQVQIVPMDDGPMSYGKDWGLGDKVTVVVQGQELSSTVSAMKLKANADGFRVGALVGDATGFNAETALAKRVTDTARRVSQLERNAESRDLGSAIESLRADLDDAVDDIAAVQTQIGTQIAAVHGEIVLSLMGVW